MGGTVPHPTAEADVAATLLDDYLKLKEKLGPLEKRLVAVKDRLRDFVTEHGHFVDEIHGVIVKVEPCPKDERTPRWPSCLFAIA